MGRKPEWSCGLLSGADYTVTFAARGTEGRELVAGIGEATEPHHNHSALSELNRWVAELYTPPERVGRYLGCTLRRAGPGAV